MQVEYKKEWMDTYLWVLPDHPTEESFEEKMIKCNPGSGRLEFLREEKDGEEYFCYKVTGKKALSSIPIPCHFKKTSGMPKICCTVWLEAPQNSA